MSRYLIVTTLVLAVVLSAGCASTGRHAESGAVLGGLLGAGAGAILGHQSGDRNAGAAIGAGFGALTGSLIGGSLDDIERESKEREARTERALHEVREREARLSILDVIRMSQAGVSDSLVIAKIEQTGSYYELSASEIIDLKRSSVSDRVISFMLRSPDRRYAAR
ncbi:MAG: YMGG-like glycine zipper-containing protein [Planctomycetota bacterium]